MEAGYCVYKHTCVINGKVYVGITKRHPQTRWAGGSGYRNNEHFYSAIKKYGWQNFEHEVLRVGLSKEEAQRMEIDLIAKYRSNDRNFGYNKSCGGDPGKGVPCTEHRKAGIRAGRLGYKCSEETKRKISEANKRRSPETIAKIAQARRGKHPWNYGLKGVDNPCYGQKRSPETREKISKATRGKPKTGTNKEVIDTETGIIYRTSLEAANAAGVSAGCVYHQCTRGKRAHRFIFYNGGQKDEAQ